MKAFIGVMIWTFLLVMSGVYINKEANEFVNYYTDKIKLIDKYVENEKWDEATSELEETYTNWVKEKGKWYVVLNHGELDTVTLYLHILRDGIEMEDPALCVEQVELIQHSFHHIIEKESYSLQNIF
jgi:hypothetical protein